MGERKGKCNWCGKEFTYINRGTVRYCSEECRRKGQESSYKKALARKRQKTFVRKCEEIGTREDSNAAIMLIAYKARMLGMTYGQYVARGLDKTNI